MPPRVSVIVTCHDIGPFLPEAVSSILAQTFQDFEIVVVDDGSRDPVTRALLDAWSEPRARLVRCPECRGPSTVRNLGVRETTAELICFLDGDDRLRPRWLEDAVALLDDDPSVALVSHWFHAFGEVEFDWSPMRCDLVAMLDACLVNGGAVLRRSVFDDVGGYDESRRDIAEDSDFWLRLMRRGHRAVILPEIHYEYRRHEGSLTFRAHRDGTQASAYAWLIRRHLDIAQVHFRELLLKRDAVAADVWKKVLGMEAEWEGYLGAQLAARREELLRARARLALNPPGPDAAPGELRARVEWLGRERERLAAMLDAERTRLAAEVADRETAARTLAAERDALRASLSWRVTAPLRWLGSLLRG